LNPTPNRRLAILDLLRGIAAIAVLCVHFPFAPSGLVLAPKGYLAVDLFFILSGFVIAQAYDDRLRSTPWFWRFCVARLIRLWPLYAFASMAGIAAIAFFPAGEQSPAKWASSLILTALFLPAPRQLSVEPGSFFPFNFAAWFYAALAPRLSSRLLTMLVGLGVAAVASICIAGYQIDGGANWRGFPFGAVRSWYGFFAGVALFRIHRRWPAPTLPSLIPAALLILALFLRSTSPVYDLVCLLFVFPLVIWIGAHTSPGSSIMAASLFLGYLSYPIYILHSPLINLMTRLRGHSGPLPGVPLLAALLLDLIPILIVGWIVARSFDTPIRAWLTRRFTPHKPVPAAETAP
jgi:peptidoglycan/LPS O-acetylase OafA/YrhL